MIEAGVLRRQEALGHDDVEPDGGHQGHDRHAQGEGLVPQHPLQAAVIAVQHALEHPLGEQIQPPVLRLVFGLQQPRAHHRRERQGDEGRDHHRRAQRDGELPEQPAHDAGHEQQRDEDRDQREAQRNDREADLLGALERRLQRRFARLDVADDVLDHHNGIIHHEPRRDGQGHQREVVQAEARPAS